MSDTNDVVLLRNVLAESAVSQASVDGYGLSDLIPSLDDIGAVRMRRHAGS